MPLDRLAIVAMLQGRVDRAVRLWGASDAVLDSVGGVLDTALGAQRAAAIASPREALGEHEFDRLLAEGWTMSLDEGIAYALEGEAG